MRSVTLALGIQRFEQAVVGALDFPVAPDSGNGGGDANLWRHVRFVCVKWAVKVVDSTYPGARKATREVCLVVWDRYGWKISVAQQAKYSEGPER